MKRRTFLQSAVGAVCLAASPRLHAAEPAKRPRILLRSSWQIVNIGDIAHTPGVLALLERYIPEADVTLWASGDHTEEVARLEHQRFPKLRIVKGSIRPDGTATNADLGDAIASADFLLHGSGASFVAEKDVAAFVKHTGKPFGLYGITWTSGGDSQKQLMSNARFIFFRDTVSLATAKAAGISCPVMEFGPDGAFACDLRNDAAAAQFLAASGLERGKFVCCIPRLRYTPYWLIKEGRAFDAAKHARNEEMREHDHAPLRDAITAVVRETDHRVLLCPEDMTQVAVGKEMLLDPLPEDVRKRVVWRDKYWLTDVALSTYLQSSGLFGLEMHSPIMCIGHGVPALVGRFDEQTTKGFMWKDIGLGDWLYDFDQPEQVANLKPTLLGVIRDPQAAQARVRQAQEIVQKRQRETMETVRKQLFG